MLQAGGLALICFLWSWGQQEALKGITLAGLFAMKEPSDGKIEPMKCG